MLKQCLILWKYWWKKVFGYYKFPKEQKIYLDQNINDKIVSNYTNVKKKVASNHWSKKENVLKLFKDEFIKEYAENKEDKNDLLQMFKYYNL